MFYMKIDLGGQQQRSRTDAEKQAYIISGHHTLNNRMCPFYVLAGGRYGIFKIT